MDKQITQFSDLLGETIAALTMRDDDKIIFTLENGDKYILYHEQDCCEYVVIEDVIGDLNDLLGAPLLMAECITNFEEDAEWKEAVESQTWTFYKLATIKGYVTLRWFGSSNGYYSESVDFGKIDNDGEIVRLD